MSVNRETLRDALQTDIRLLTGLASDVVDGVTYTHVWTELPPTFGGLSPCVTIENGGWMHSLDLGDDVPTQVRFIIGYWRKIDTRSNAEDALDLFARELVGVMQRKYNARYYQDSMPFYELIEGVEYRGEYHFIQLEEV